jgi:hypothetical protein
MEFGFELVKQIKSLMVQHPTPHSLISAAFMITDSHLAMPGPSYRLLWVMHHHRSLGAVGLVL